MSSVIEIFLKSKTACLINSNQYLMEVSCATKKKPAYIKFAITDDIAEGLLKGKMLTTFIACDKQDWIDTKNKLLEEEK